MAFFKKGSFLEVFGGLSFFSFLLLVGGTAALYFSGWDDWWRLKERGVRVEAGVLGMETEYREPSVNSEVGFLHHHVRARFLEQGSETAYHDAQYEVSGRTYKRLQGMDPPRLEILYDRLDPGLSTPVEEMPGSFLAVPFGLGLILLGVLIFRACIEDHRNPGRVTPESLPIDKLLNWLNEKADRIRARFPRDHGGS